MGCSLEVLLGGWKERIPGGDRLVGGKETEFRVESSKILGVILVIVIIKSLVASPHMSDNLY
jgi:hypothetical protein